MCIFKFLKEHLGEKVDVEEDIAKKSKNIGDCCFGILRVRDFPCTKRGVQTTSMTPLCLRT